MKVLIFGGTGLLGKALVREWRSDSVTALGSRDVDIRDIAQVQRIVGDAHPDWIVLAAAYTDVDGCETNREQAFSVNRDGAVVVARAAKDAGSRLIFLSSDYVFNGKKTLPYEVDDKRNPQSVYGRSKAEAEVNLMEVLPGCCIARTSWVFGVGGRCFPGTILRLAANRATIDVVNDQRGCPTYTVDLARAIIQLCHKDAGGIVHVTNTGECSWFEFAEAIIREGGLTTEVRPVTTQQMPRPAQRPAYSVLSATSLHTHGIEMPGWKDALRRYLEEGKS
ncbi:MAG TPA: dTDP-4-dehydrorhamnose reductase [Candidatus Sulfotelmatobacter sp.]|nr:dTDP-4-dehydrorhamnose reductase [Candidatus Sulfotelmatobacter sp.]